MGKIITTLINHFDGGISNDLRAGWVSSKDFFTTNKFSITKHFDIFTYPKKLVPYYATVADEEKTYSITKFLIAPYPDDTTTPWRVFGLGINNTTEVGLKIHHDDLTETGWTGAGGGASGVTGRSPDVFFYYKNGIFVFASGHLLRFDTTAGTFNDNYQDIAWTTVAQPIHHPNDDIAYFFYTTATPTCIVAKLNDTVFTASALALPTNQKIVAACPFGNYLAIACVTITLPDIQSIVYLWDRDSSITNLTERIDFGPGEIIHLATLNNKLIAVMTFFGNSALALDKIKVFVKQANGQTAYTLNTLTADDDVIATFLPKTRIIEDNKLYFPMSIPLNGDTRNGIWVVDSLGQMTLDFQEEEVESAATKTYQGIFKLGNIWFIAHSNDGSINKTDTTKAYSNTLASVYESLIFNAGDPDITKKLVRVVVNTEPLPSAGKIIVKYRKDTDLDSTWTTIFTNTIDDSVGQRVINISGVALPDYKEIQLRVESYGGATITQIKFESEVLDKTLDGVY